jgi:hypothetical protein
VAVATCGAAMVPEVLWKRCYGHTSRPSSTPLDDPKPTQVGQLTIPRSGEKRHKARVRKRATLPGVVD